MTSTVSLFVKMQRRKGAKSPFNVCSSPKCHDCSQTRQRTRLEPGAGSGLDGGLRNCFRAVAVKMLMHRCHGVPNANDPLPRAFPNVLPRICPKRVDGGLVLPSVAEPTPNEPRQGTTSRACRRISRVQSQFPQCRPERNERGIDNPLPGSPAACLPTPRPLRVPRTCAGRMRRPIVQSGASNVSSCVGWILRGLRRGPNAGHGVGNGTMQYENRGGVLKRKEAPRSFGLIFTTCHPVVCITTPSRRHCLHQNLLISLRHLRPPQKTPYRLNPPSPITAH